MTPELWQKVSQAWERHFSLAAEDRDTFLEQLRSNDGDVAAELEALLAQQQGGRQASLQAPSLSLMETISHSDPKPISSPDASPDPPGDPGSATVDFTGGAADSVVATPQTQKAPLPDEFPRQAGRYIIEEEIGQGGMGSVLRARDPDFERTLAVKIMRPKALKIRARRSDFSKKPKSPASCSIPAYRRRTSWVAWKTVCRSSP